jgi:hypothetical protein
MSLRNSTYKPGTRPPAVSPTSSQSSSCNQQSEGHVDRGDRLGTNALFPHGGFANALWPPRPYGSSGAGYRNLPVWQMTQTKNKASGLLMESGVEYKKQKSHQKSISGNCGAHACLFATAARVEPDNAGRLRQDGAATGERYSARSTVLRTNPPLDDNPGRRRDHCHHMGAGDRGCGPFFQTTTTNRQ